MWRFEGMAEDGWRMAVGVTQLAFRPIGRVERQAIWQRADKRVALTYSAQAPQNDNL